MTDAEHYRKLERLYAAAPISQWYGATIAIAEGQAEVRIATRAEFYHAAHAVHGSVYFRALDDAAFFAVNSGAAGSCSRGAAASSHAARLRWIRVSGTSDGARRRHLRTLSQCSRGSCSSAMQKGAAQNVVGIFPNDASKRS